MLAQPSLIILIALSLIVDDDDEKGREEGKGRIAAVSGEIPLSDVDKNNGLLSQQQLHRQRLVRQEASNDSGQCSPPHLLLFLTLIFTFVCGS